MNNLLKTIFIATSLHFVHTAIFYKDNCIIKMQQKKQTTGKQKMTTKISIPILRTIGALPDTVYSLFVLIIIDYITGVCLAVSEQKISSKIGTKGIAAKVLIVCFVTLSYIVDTWILDSREKFSSITILFYYANEVISIFENVNHFGLPLPRKFKEYLAGLKSKKSA